MSSQLRGSGLLTKQHRTANPHLFYRVFYLCEPCMRIPDVAVATKQEYCSLHCSFEASRPRSGKARNNQTPESNTMRRYQSFRAAFFTVLTASSSGFSPISSGQQSSLLVASNRQPSSSSCLTQLSATEQVRDAPSSATDTKVPAIDEYALDELNKCTSGTAARKVLEKALLSSNAAIDNDDNAPSNRLYASLSIPRGASERSLSDADLAIQTGIRNSKYSVMELIELNGDRDADRAALSLLCVTVGSMVSALAANQNLPGPDIVRFVVVWLLSFAPLAFVGTGIAAPAELQAVLVRIQRELLPTYRRRMLQHEAGHFLLGHLLGLPIKGYRANAVKNAVEFYPLSDEDVGLDRARMLGFDKARINENGGDYPAPADGGSQPYFSEGGRGDRAMQTSVFREKKDYANNPFLKLPSQNDPKQAWPYRGFDEETLDQLAIISVAGVCAEILAFGNAEGGYADLSQLRQLFNAAEPELDEKAMENRIRYSLGYGISQLRRHLGALDALVEVMERDGSVAECVMAIEQCENVSGATVGDYERIRREKIRSDGVAFIERILLGGGKNADTEDDGVVYGKGGGERKKRFVLTGDDPLYAAGAAALAFFVWASSGGVSLH